MVTAEPSATYEEVARDYAGPLERLVHGYEARPDRQRDLLQEIHVGLWRGLPSFDGRSSLRTWVYRVAHNVAITHVMRSARDQLTGCLPLEAALDVARLGPDPARDTEQRDDVTRLASLVRKLRAADRQIILLYLEGFDHAEIAEVCGISRENAATKVHRIKQALVSAFAKGGSDASR